MITDRLSDGEVECAEKKEKHEIFRKDLPVYSHDDVTKHSNK